MNRTITLLASLAVLFAACEKPDKQECVYSCDVGHIKYEATIGYSFASALDSLSSLVAYTHNEPYILVPEPLAVAYPTNDREFYWIAVKDTANSSYLESPMDVLDTKGDWYKIIWGND